MATGSVAGARAYHWLMSRWEPGARERLVEAAFDLFEQQGFAHTAVPQIAAQAGVTNRTFYRYFSDKRDVLFDTDTGGAAEVRASLEAAPDDLAHADFVVWAVATLVRSRFEGRRDEVRRQRRIIASDESLRERAAHKRELQYSLLTGILRERGLEQLRARLLAEVMTSAMNLAVDAWLERDDDVGADAIALEALGELYDDLEGASATMNRKK